MHSSGFVQFRGATVRLNRCQERKDVLKECDEEGKFENEWRLPDQLF